MNRERCGKKYTNVVCWCLMVMWNIYCQNRAIRVCIDIFGLWEVFLTCILGWWLLAKMRLYIRIHPFVGVPDPF